MSCADYRAGPRSGCTCLAALRCVITTRSHILRVRPLLFPRVDLSFPPPINKRERPVPQEGSTRGRGESCHSIRPPPSACCCCCFTKPIKGGPIPIGRQASYDSTIFVFYTAHTHGPRFCRGFLPADALLHSLLVSPDLPFQMYLVSERERETSKASTSRDAEDAPS